MTNRNSPVAKARYLATSAHSGQKDKIGEEYIYHPAKVASLLQQFPGFSSLTLQDQADATAAAWLHDVLEDTSLQATDLEREGFSPTVVEAVVALTFRQGEPRERYYSRVRANPLARIVKIADVAHNSSVDRLRWLDSATRQRLQRKYEKASRILIDDEVERSWFEEIVSSTAQASR